MSTSLCTFLSTHADEQGVDISFTVCFFVCFCLFVCLFVRLRISPARIKLPASNFARWFMGVLGRESPILGNFAPQKLKIRRIGERASASDDTRQSPLHAPFVKSRGV